MVANTANLCPHCGERLSDSLRHCPTCSEDAGAPNVRVCKDEENKQSLDSRYDQARMLAISKGCTNEFNVFSKIMENDSFVVISMPANFARTFFENPKSIYATYEELVGTGRRKPASFKEDTQRIGVGGTLFGFYHDKIRYGVLSLTNNGLHTYGHISCKLRTVAITKRTSFLEVNSYTFIEEHNIFAGGSLPPGYRATWEDRHKLALAKLADRLENGQTVAQWQSFLVFSDGQDRSADDFIEAHIYEGFDGYAIEDVSVISPAKLSREDKLDIKIAMSSFKKLKGKKP